ncbi:CPBP family intramembrane glutamic endopeptidase [Psychrobacillus sp.]|uniref:CPBP family intramembrane glutamic endopeptidase n=1 Tax=Psychrobacillus sp. TaxID=1871623 RepID=UPI0028BE6E2F|nr:CPBP family intramembrane glutamic endopeptidase [Psychrobacillus sp.]
MQSINLIISAILQILLFSIIPFIWWFFSGRKKSSFLNWIGIKIPVVQDKKKFIITFMLSLVLLFVVSFLVVPLFVDSSDLATSQFEGAGIAVIIPVLIYAFVQTGFSEELFFRGFLTKRLVGKFGFNMGNAIQGLLFGLVHGVMFVSLAGLLGTLVIILMTGIAGWLMGWINEKQSGGSILSSWLLHGCANALASIFSMFTIF